MTNNKLKQRIGFVFLISALFFYSCAKPKDMRPVSFPPLLHAPVTVDSETELFSRAEKMFRLKSYPQALSLYDEYLAKFPEGISVPAALMKKGGICMAMGNYETARTVYTYLIDRYPNSFLIPDAKIEILTTFYNEGKYEELIRYADEVGKNVGSRENVIKIYILLGDAYMHVNSPVNAINFYAKAQEYLRYPEKEHIISKLKEAVEQLSTEDILFLLERLKDPLTKGYLMYRLGLDHVDQERYEDAVSVLSEFVRALPEHKMAGEANRLIAELDRMPRANLCTIGCLLPLTGSYKIYGNRALRGIELALEQSHARDGSSPPINLIIKDTASDPEEAIRAVKALAEEQVSAIIGPIITAEAAASEAQNNGIPIITLTQKEKITDIGDYVFRNFLTPKMQVQAMVSYAIEELGLNNFAILYPEEKYGTTFMRLFWDEVLSHGRNVVGIESYQPNQTDFGNSIRKLAKHRKKGSEPSARAEAIFIPDAPAKAGLIAPQLAFYDVHNVQLLGTNLWHSEELIRMAKKFVQGAIFPDIFFAESKAEEVRNFVRDFQKTFGELPGFIEAIAYDTATMLFHKVRRPDIRYKNTLKDELMQVRDLQGVTGLTSYDESGEAHKKLYLLKIKGRGFVELENR